MNYTFLYAGPVIGAIFINLSWSLIATICVYIYINRKKYTKIKLLMILTKPLHNIIKNIAKNKIEETKKEYNKK